MVLVQPFVSRTTAIGRRRVCIVVGRTRRKTTINRTCNAAINVHYTDAALFDKSLDANYAGSPTRREWIGFGSSAVVGAISGIIGVHRLLFNATISIYRGGDKCKSASVEIPGRIPRNVPPVTITVTTISCDRNCFSATEDTYTRVRITRCDNVTRRINILRRK